MYFFFDGFKKRAHDFSLLFNTLVLCKQSFVYRVLSLTLYFYIKVFFII